MQIDRAEGGRNFERRSTVEEKESKKGAGVEKEGSGKIQREE
jgi:hypothetical protein